MDAVREMERQMRLNEDVLRYMTIRVSELEEEPSAQAQIKSTYSNGNQDDGEFKARSPEERDIPKAPSDCPADPNKLTSKIFFSSSYFLNFL